MIAHTVIMTMWRMGWEDRTKNILLCVTVMHEGVEFYGQEGEVKGRIKEGAGNTDYKEEDMKQSQVLSF